MSSSSKAPPPESPPLKTSSTESSASASDPPADPNGFGSRFVGSTVCTASTTATGIRAVSRISSVATAR